MSKGICLSPVSAFTVRVTWRMISASSRLGLRISSARASVNQLLLPFGLSAATLFGWVVYDHLPGAVTWAGMAIVACSGLAIALHERRRAQIA